MAIILDDIERNYLLGILKKTPSTHLWAHKKIIEKLEDEIELIDKIANCNHEFAPYTGKKTCCVYCETKDDSPFSWSLDK